MRDFPKFTLFILPLILSVVSIAAEAPASQSCVIVKRHVHKFGENATRFHPHRPFDYVEGEYPAQFKWRSELGDGDVRDLKQKGGKIVIMRPDYQLPDLEESRRQCKETSSPSKE